MLRVAGVLGLALSACTAVPEGTVVDVDGRAHAPLAVNQAPAHVFLFLLPDCPIANSYAPEIAAIRQAFEPAGVRFFLVHVQPDLAPDAARAHAAAYGHRGPVLIDRDHALVRATGVTVTPEAAVLARDGALFYRGRIDDLYADVGKKRHAATTHELRDALAAVVAGQPAPVARTLARGCFISDAAAANSPR
jgi:hypothetical protein